MGLDTMWLRRPLQDILSSGAKVAVLRVLFTSPVPFSVREIARRADITPGHASRVLGDLAASGVLTARDHGGAKTYEMCDSQAPIIAALRELFWAETDRVHSVIGQLHGVADSVLSLILYGSEARGDASPGSDTDVLAVVEEDTDKLREALLDKCVELSMEQVTAISLHVVDLEKLADWEETVHPLWQSIKSEGRWLQGKQIEELIRRCRMLKAT